jgi:gas vesicle protein
VGQDPEAIRREIEDTRERMGETADALAYKADVPSRTKEAVSDKVQSVKEKVTGTAGRVSDATPDGEQAKQQAKRAVGIAQENPLGLAIGSVAIGFLAGMLVPSTQVEQEKIGPMAHQVRDQVTDTAQTAVEHGKQVAQDAAQAATETAKQSGQEHAGQVQDEAKQAVQDTREQVTSS